jgi:hypothetical protein
MVVLLLSVPTTFKIMEKGNGKERGVGKNEKGKKKKDNLEGGLCG